MKKGLNLRVSEAINSPKLLGPFFAGPSWFRWKAILKAAFGEKMSPDEIGAFKEVAERNPPKNQVRKFVVIGGRGSGKDSVASGIATITGANFRGKLRPGEKAIVMVIAVDRTQAGICYRYIRGYFEKVPALAALVKSFDRGSIELKNGVVIEVHTNSYRSVRGRSILCAIFDEVAFWRSEDSATPDVEVAGAVTPGLARVPGSMMILISSAHKRAGLLYKEWKDNYGRESDDTLVVRATTPQLNPLFDTNIIEQQIAEDSQLYNAEYNSIWRDDLATFITRDLIEAAVDRGVIVRPPQSAIHYESFVDPSGGGPDSFTAGVTHREKNDVVVLDCLVEIRNANPDIATREIAAVLHSYGVKKTVGDRYAKNWPVVSFARHGITMTHSERDRSELYLECLPLFSAGRVKLIDNPKLAAQFAALERRTFSSGQDKVDHPSRGHDDLSNAAAGALVLAAVQKPPMNVTAATLNRASMPTAYSHRYPESSRRSRSMRVFF